MRAQACSACLCYTPHGLGVQYVLRCGGLEACHSRMQSSLLIEGPLSSPTPLPSNPHQCTHSKCSVIPPSASCAPVRAGHDAWHGPQPSGRLWRRHDVWAAAGRAHAAAGGRHGAALAAACHRAAHVALAGRAGLYAHRPLALRCWPSSGGGSSSRSGSALPAGVFGAAGARARLAAADARHGRGAAAAAGCSRGEARPLPARCLRCALPCASTHLKMCRAALCCGCG